MRASLAPESAPSWSEESLAETIARDVKEGLTPAQGTGLDQRCKTAQATRPAEGRSATEF